MQVVETPLEGLVQLIPTLYHDDRGYFMESWKKETFDRLGIHYEFVQENHSYSKAGVIRGLHLQRDPYAQAKLVGVVSGKVLEVVVDLRENSKTYKQVYTCVLDGISRVMLMVPDGFAHGFAALEPTLFTYKCSNPYNKAAEAGIRYDDPDLKIDWMVSNPIVSEKDQHLPTLKEFLGIR